MGLKRFVSSMLRSAPIRSSKPGQLAAGCPSVFTEDGMWTAMERQKQIAAKKSPKKPQEDGLDLQPGHRLPRKRCWLTKRTDPELGEK